MIDPLVARTVAHLAGRPPKIAATSSRRQEAEAPSSPRSTMGSPRRGPAHRAGRIEFAIFAKRLLLVQQVTELAEAEGHHPDISFGWALSSDLLT